MIMNAICHLFPHTSRDEIAAQLAKLQSSDVEFHRLREGDNQGVLTAA
jgi:hypothetical protein